MEVLNLLSVSNILIAIGVIFLLAVLLNSFVIVGGNEIVVLERRWFGKQIQDGRIFALNDEVGIQVRNLMPGFHFLVPFLYKVKKGGLINISEDEVGIVESFDGVAIPNNRIFAKKIEGHHNFQDAESFIKNGGEKGVQADILPQGEYRINPMFSVSNVPMIVIKSNEVGIVSAQDGLPLREGQLFADSIKGHQSFQNIEEFLANKGQKGPQINVLKPGKYKINTQFFKVKVVPAVNIRSDEIGLVTAKYGLPLPKNETVAITVEGHNSYQDGQAFIDNGGQKGRQNEYLSSGMYYLNTDLFQVEAVKQLEIPTGNVGVMVSFIGIEPTKEIEFALSGSQSQTASSDEIMQEGQSMPELYKGIQHKILRPGLYPVNSYAYNVQLIDITNISVEWDSHGEGSKQFRALQVLSQDGFNLTVAVKVIVRVRPQQAPLVVAKVGSIEKLIKDVIDPIISASFRNQASTASAISFLQDRKEEQAKAEEHVKEELLKYNVECVSVLITNINIPQELMDTQTKKVIAEQEIEQFIMQQKSQSERVKTENTKAMADQQPNLVNAEISVQIASKKKQELITLAEGNAEAQKLEGKGQSEKLEYLGIGEASQIKSVAQARAYEIEQIGLETSKAYQLTANAIGKEGLISLEQIKGMQNIIKPGVKFVPDVVVNGGGNAIDGLWGSVSKVIGDLKIGDQSSAKTMQQIIEEGKKLFQDSKIDTKPVEGTKENVPDVKKQENNDGLIL